MAARSVDPITDLTRSPMEPAPIKILLADDHLIAAVKPAGLSTTAPPGGISLQTRLRSQLSRGDGYLTAVHRLDRSTTGIVLIAVTKRAAGLLSKQFAAGRIDKTYVAVVHCPHRPPLAPQQWTDWIAKVEGQPRGVIVDSGAAGGKRCQTTLSHVESGSAAHRDSASGLTAETMSGPVATFWLRPHTGRMHQLRIQCATRGYPIVGDTVYGRRPIAAGEETTLALFATELSFFHPATAARITLAIPEVVRGAGGRFKA